MHCSQASPVMAVFICRRNIRNSQPNRSAPCVGKSYVEVALAVLTPFTGGEIPAADFERMVREAYGTFRHDAVRPLVQTDANEFVLELSMAPPLPSRMSPCSFWPA